MQGLLLCYNPKCKINPCSQLLGAAYDAGLSQEFIVQQASLAQALIPSNTAKSQYRQANYLNPENPKRNNYFIISTPSSILL